MELTEVDLASAKSSEILIVTGLVSLLLVSTVPAFALLLATTLEFEPLLFDTLPELHAAEVKTATSKAAAHFLAIIIFSPL
jgi:hypothetical protein